MGATYNNPIPMYKPLAFLLLVFSLTGIGIAVGNFFSKEDILGDYSIQMLISSGLVFCACCYALDGQEQ